MMNGSARSSAKNGWNRSATLCYAKYYRHSLVGSNHMRHSHEDSVERSLVAWPNIALVAPLDIVRGG